MIGAIIGNIVGSRFEFNNQRNKNFDLFTEDCFVTDDSIMTLAIAKAIMETEKMKETITKQADFDEAYYRLLEEMAVKYMQQIGRPYPLFRSVILPIRRCYLPFQSIFLPIQSSYQPIHPSFLRIQS